MWWFVLVAVSHDELFFIDGCWERGVGRVVWARSADDWTGTYEQNGPKDTRVRATLRITDTGGGLLLATTDEVCEWERCLVPFHVEGAFARRTTELVVLGRDESAFWLGYDTARDRLWFGQAEANLFTRCAD